MRRGGPRFAAWGLVLLALAAACNRRSLSPDDAGGTGHVGIDGAFESVTDLETADAGRDGNADGAGSGGGDSGGGGETITCGAVTCGGTDLCVETYGCGGPLNCNDLTDAGTCPPGWTENSSCRSVTGRAGCTPICPPPSYACVPKPAACAGEIDCVCVPASVCTWGTCLRAQFRSVECGAS